jgi:hypothetical protein
MNLKISVKIQEDIFPQRLHQNSNKKEAKCTELLGTRKHCEYTCITKEFKTGLFQITKCTSGSSQSPT